MNKNTKELFKDLIYRKTYLYTKIEHDFVMSDIHESSGSIT